MGRFWTGIRTIGIARTNGLGTGPGPPLMDSSTPRQRGQASSPSAESAAVNSALDNRDWPHREPVPAPVRKTLRGVGEPTGPLHPGPKACSNAATIGDTTGCEEVLTGPSHPGSKLHSQGRMSGGVEEPTRPPHSRPTVHSQDAINGGMIGCEQRPARLSHQKLQMQYHIVDEESRRVMLWGRRHGGEGEPEVPPNLGLPRNHTVATQSGKLKSLAMPEGTPDSGENRQFAIANKGGIHRVHGQEQEEERFRLRLQDIESQDARSMRKSEQGLRRTGPGRYSRRQEMHLVFVWIRAKEQDRTTSPLAILQMKSRRTGIEHSSSRLRGIRLKICLDSIQGEMRDQPIDRQEILITLRREEHRSGEGLHQVLRGFIVANS